MLEAMVFLKNGGTKRIKQETEGIKDKGSQIGAGKAAIITNHIKSLQCPTKN